MKLPSIPEGLELDETLPGAVIRRRWLNWTFLPLLGFTIVWDCFIGFFYGAMLHSPNVSWIAVVFPLGHLGIGLWMTYFCLAMLFNRTEVRITPNGIAVWHGPVPWAGRKTVPAAEIADLVVRWRTASQPTQRGYSYTVYYVDSARRERKLLTGLPHEEQAEFVAEEARERLGIGKPEGRA